MAVLHNHVTGGQGQQPDADSTDRKVGVQDWLSASTSRSTTKNGFGGVELSFAGQEETCNIIYILLFLGRSCTLIPSSTLSNAPLSSWKSVISTFPCRRHELWSGNPRQKTLFSHTAVVYIVHNPSMKKAPESYCCGQRCRPSILPAVHHNEGYGVEKEYSPFPCTWIWIYGQQRLSANILARASKSLCLSN